MSEDEMDLQREALIRTPDTSDTATPPLPVDLPNEVRDGDPDAGDPDAPVGDEETP